MDIYDITATALTAQRLRLDTISSNLANANSTRKADGTIGAYKRKEVIFAPLLENQSQKIGGFHSPESVAGGLPMLKMGPGGRPTLTASIQSNQFEGAGVKVTQIQEDTKTPIRMEYNPSHPDANKDGFVEMPNINMVQEMIDMISANRAYEANVTAFQSAKSMNQASLQL